MTLELALAGVPLVGAYRGHPLEAFVARRLIRSHSVLMCNLVLGRNVAPELLQDDATPQALADALMTLIQDTPARAAQLAAFAEIDGIMMRPDGRAASDLAVDAALEVVAGRTDRPSSRA